MLMLGRTYALRDRLDRPRSRLSYVGDEHYFVEDQLAAHQAKAAEIGRSMERGARDFASKTPSPLDWFLSRCRKTK